MLDTPQGLQAIEIKSGSTFSSDWLKGLKKWQSHTGEKIPVPSVIYGGTESYDREGCQVIGWPEMGT